MGSYNIMRKEGLLWRNQVVFTSSQKMMPQNVVLHGIFTDFVGAVVLGFDNFPDQTFQLPNPNIYKILPFNEFYLKKVIFTNYYKIRTYTIDSELMIVPIELLHTNILIVGDDLQVEITCGDVYTYLFSEYTYEDVYFYSNTILESIGQTYVLGTITTANDVVNTYITNSSKIVSLERSEPFMIKSFQYDALPPIILNHSIPFQPTKITWNFMANQLDIYDSLGLIESIPLVPAPITYPCSVQWILSPAVIGHMKITNDDFDYTRATSGSDIYQMQLHGGTFIINSLSWSAELYIRNWTFNVVPTSIVINTDTHWLSVYDGLTTLLDEAIV